MVDYEVDYYIEIEELDPCSKKPKIRKKEIHFETPEQAADFVKVLMINGIRFDLHYEDLEVADFIEKQMEEKDEQRMDITP